MLNILFIKKKFLLIAGVFLILLFAVISFLQEETVECFTPATNKRVIVDARPRPSRQTGLALKVV